MLTSLLVLGWAGNSAVFAQSVENGSPPKSLTTALLLGLDPLPADSLFYAGKTLQASGNLALGVGGTGLLMYGLIEGMRSCHPFEENCATGKAAGVSIVTGAVAYLSSFIWDLAGGLHYTREKNRSSDSSALSWSAIRPTLELKRRGAFAGLRLDF